MKTDTTSQEFFEQKYRENPDPWNFASSAYEESRYQATFNALKQRRYQRAFEPGCSIGVLTARLASICDQVEALDISATAVKQARERCKSLPNVNIIWGALLGAMPDGTFDLIVLSEIGYYFTANQLTELGNELVHRLRPHGAFLATHWLGDSPDHQLSGDQVHQIVGALENLTHEYAERHAGFRLDRWIHQ